VSVARRVIFRQSFRYLKGFSWMNELSRLLAVLQFLRARVSRDLPLQQAVLLLTVAARPGITMPELMPALAMPQGTVSRNVKALAHTVSWQNGVAVPRGYGLLRTQPSVDNRQVLAVYLTGRGEALLEEMARLLGGYPGAGDAAVLKIRQPAADSSPSLSH
jgi:DNA-binding MarR family transcriptional regulator